MAKYQAEVPTEQASRYLQQLCKHWRHRFEVAFDATQGTVHLGGAECRFAAHPHALTITLAGDDAEALPRLCDVVTDHLRRFAFREALEVRWAEQV